MDDVVGAFNAHERVRAPEWEHSDNALPAFLCFLTLKAESSSARVENAKSASIHILTRWSKRPVQWHSAGEAEDEKDGREDRERVMDTLFLRHFACAPRLCHAASFSICAVR